MLTDSDDLGSVEGHRRLTRSGTTLFLSESIASLLLMLTGFFIARLSSVTDFGRFTAALAFATIVGIIVDSGMGMRVARDIARKSSQKTKEVNQIFTWRLGVIGLACLAAPVLAHFLLPLTPVRRVADGLVPAVLLLNLGDFFVWIFKGELKVRTVAFLQIGSRFTLLLFCFAALFSTRPVPYLVAAYAITGTGMTLAGFLVLSREGNPLHLVSLPSPFFRETLPEVYKLGVTLILSVAFSRVDLMIVAALKGPAEAGLYSAAGRALDAVRLLPMVAYSVYLPIFGTLHKQLAALRLRFIQAYFLLLLAGLTIALMGSQFAEPLLTIVLGERYAAAAGCFRPLIWTSVLLCTNLLFFALLYTQGDHRTPLLSISAAFVVEVLLDFILVPRYGIVAAGWSRLAAESVNAAIMVFGIVKRDLIPVTQLLAKPLTVIGAAVGVLLLMGNSPASYRFATAWTISLVLTGFLAYSTRSLPTPT